MGRIAIIVVGVIFLIGCGSELNVMESVEVVDINRSKCEIYVEQGGNIVRMTSNLPGCRDISAMEIGNIVDLFYKDGYIAKRVVPSNSGK